MELPAPYAPYSHERGYIVLPVELDASRLPSVFEVGEHTLTIKEEFHVTLVGKTVTGFFPSGETVTDLFARYVAAHLIRFEAFEPEFRLAVEGERHALVVRARVSNLEGLFAELRTALARDVPLQATHVTLYTLTRGKSIAIPSEALWESFPAIELPELFAKLNA